MSIYPLSDWDVVLLRFTAFPVTAERPKDLHWWADIVGGEPEARTLKNTPAAIEESGQLDDRTRLSLTVTSVRTDLVATAAKTTPSPLPDVIGALPDVCPRFVDLIDKWLSLPNRFAVQRIAFGAILLHEESNREQGYERIAKFLSNTVKVDPLTWRDLLFQLNRPTTVPSTALEINRVAKWAVVAATGIMLGGGGSPQTIPEPAFATSLELDFSTSAEHRGALPDKNLTAISHDLSEQAVKMAADGDNA